jgi:hypothetical protein
MAGKRKRAPMSELPIIRVTEELNPATGQVERRHTKTPHAEHLANWLRQKIKRPRLLARVLEANKDTQAGDGVRSYHRTQWDQPWRWSACMTKGAVIRRHGRAAWDRIAPHHKRKQGRREYAYYVGIIEAGVAL